MSKKKIKGEIDLKKYTKEELIELFHHFGVPDAEYWAEQELKDKDLAVLAIFRFLRPLQDILDRYLYHHDEWVKVTMERRYNPCSEVVKEMVNAGIASEKIGWLLYWVVREALCLLIYHLDDPRGYDYDLPNQGEDLPRWTLMEYIEHKEGDKSIIE
jgi:hypothetical protein